MGRASRADAARHREEVVAAAARLFRERGLSGVSVPDVMAEAGLTHGGFYRHFDSKDALAAAACEAAFAQQTIDRADDLARYGGDRAAARADLIARYFSPEHRDDPGGGCPNAGLVSDAARSPSDSPLRAAFTEGVRTSVQRPGAPTHGSDTSGPDTPGPDTPGPDTPGPDTPGPDTHWPDTHWPDAKSRADALADLATMVGAVMLARATAGDPLSEEILAAAHTRLTPKSDR
jgi:TetR/AcrR family transcriptional repressor of nem operon